MTKTRLTAICLLLTHLLSAQDKPSLPIPQLLSRLSGTTNDTAHLHLLLTIADAYILKAGEDHHGLDSALLLISEAANANDEHSRDPRIAGLCYLLTAKARRERGDDSLAKLNAFKALDTFRRQDDLLDRAYAYCEAARHYSYLVSHEDSIRIAYYRLAIPVFDSLGRTQMQAETRELLGDCLLNLNGATEALPVLQQALKLYTTMDHPDLRNLYSLLGRCYGDIGDAQQAIDYELKAVRLEEAEPAPLRGLITAYNRLVYIYVGLGDLGNATIYCTKGLNLAKQLKRDEDIYLLGLNLAILQMRTGKLEQALQLANELAIRYPTLDHIQQTKIFVLLYTKMGRMDKATKYGEELALLYDQSPNDNIRVGVLSALLEYTFTKRQFDRAKKYALQTIDLSNRLGLMDFLTSASKMLFRIDSARGDLAAALREYEHYILLRDSLGNITRARQIAGLRLEFDTEKKDADIKSLTKSQQLSQTALYQVGVTRNAIIGAAILLLILLLVSINRYRLKQRSNRQLNRLLGEKEWLVKEIHHRVKNNLQLAMSLLNTQSFYIENEKAQEAIRQSRNRMYAMSLIHQRLYQVENLETIEMGRYIPELVEYIQESMEADGKLSFDVDVDPLKLDVAQAIPLGLILNEAITNAIKHAFSGRDCGRITIRLHEIAPPGRIRLMIADNGVGLPDPAADSGRRSMGRQLIGTLVAQLDAHMTIANKGGLVITIDFDIAPHRTFVMEDRPAMEKDHY